MLTASPPRYVLHEELGRGGMGVVYRATLVGKAGDREVAIKRLLPGHRLDDDAKRRLLAEAQLAFRLRHANICQVLDVGEGDDGTFLIMEYLPGLDLRALLRGLAKSRRRLDVASVLYIGREVARALDYAHRRTDSAGTPLGVVHGDVTPQNILLSEEGEVKLTDFGVARALRPREAIGGTHGFLAPEVLQGAGDHRADQYGLALTLCAALSGEVADDQAPDLTRLAEPAGELAKILKRGSAESPDRRYLSTAELERELATELARRHPTFTPLLLGRLVREVRADVYTPVTQSGVTSLRSLMQVREEKVAEPFLSPPTETVNQEPRSGRKGVLPLGLTAAAALLGLAYHLSRSGARPAGHVEAGGSAASIHDKLGIDMVIAPPPSAVVAPPSRAPRPRPGYLSVGSDAWGAVFVDGTRVAAETPLFHFALPPGEHRVTVRFSDGKMAPVKRVRVVAGRTAVIQFGRQR